MASATVSFKLSVSAFDAMRRIIDRDFESSKVVHAHAMTLEEKDPERMTLFRDLQRREFERDQIKHELGI